MITVSRVNTLVADEFYEIASVPREFFFQPFPVCNVLGTAWQRIPKELMTCKRTSLCIFMCFARLRRSGKGVLVLQLRYELLEENEGHVLKDIKWVH